MGLAHGVGERGAAGAAAHTGAMEIAGTVAGRERKETRGGSVRLVDPAHPYYVVDHRFGGAGEFQSLRAGDFLSRVPGSLPSPFRRTGGLMGGRGIRRRR